jgi:hypothetical protein
MAKVWVKRWPTRFMQVWWHPRRYTFEVRNGLAIAQVEEEDVEGLLRKPIGCCGHKRKVFFLATEGEVEKWLEPTPDELRQQQS